jgi:hypothetical protein
VIRVSFCGPWARECKFLWLRGRNHSLRCVKKQRQTPLRRTCSSLEAHGFISNYLFPDGDTVDIISAIQIVELSVGTDRAMLDHATVIKANSTLEEVPRFKRIRVTNTLHSYLDQRERMDQKYRGHLNHNPRRLHRDNLLVLLRYGCRIWCIRLGGVGIIDNKDMDGARVPLFPSALSMSWCLKCWQWDWGPFSN